MCVCMNVLSCSCVSFKLNPWPTAAAMLDALSDPGSTASTLEQEEARSLPLGFELAACVVCDSTHEDRCLLLVFDPDVFFIYFV